jgi:O-methyltransferase
MDQATPRLRSLYLNQLTRDLTGFDGGDEFIQIPLGKYATNPIRRFVARRIGSMLEARKLETVRRVKFDREMRSLGRDWPRHADTMIGLKRLENVRYCVETALNDGVPGDMVETGVWRGGGSIMMRAVLEAFGDPTRQVWCADSFEGLPPPDMERYPQDAGMNWHTFPELAISLEQVQANFQKYGLLDNRVKFLKGWFKDTLPQAPIEQIAVLRLDGDLYASTMDALTSLYHKVSPGGFVIVDDYGIPEDICRNAVNDFRESHGITDPIQDIDGFGVFWRLGITIVH